MPRIKGSKNKPKAAEKALPVAAPAVVAASVEPENTKPPFTMTQHPKRGYWSVTSVVKGKTITREFPSEDAANDYVVGL